MQIPRSYIDNYSKALDTLSEQAREKLVKALEKLDYSASIEDIRNAVIAVMGPACGASAETAARLAAEFYGGLRGKFAIDSVYKATAISLRNPEETESAVRAFVQVLVDGGEPEEFVKKCAERLDNETRRAANECVAYNAKKDPRKPKWARIPKPTAEIYAPWSKEPGVTHNKDLARDGTCPWCNMLASLGFAYQSDETASHSHPFCDCRVVPGWGDKPEAQGYNPKAYADKWMRSASRPKDKADEPKDGKKPARKEYDGLFPGGVPDMRAYLEASTSLDELYKRADVVLAEVNEYWGGDRHVFSSVSYIAKQMRDKLSS